MSIRLLLCVLIYFAIQATHTASSATHINDRPNIIVVITDDQGYAPVGRHGHPWLRTPNLDTLYDKSTRFTRFFVSPTCAPTRSALMTGRHPLKNGVTHTILERERLALDAVTLPQILKSVGYNTGIFGKWHLGDQQEYQPGNRGFDEVFIHGAGGIGQVLDGSCADVPNNKYFDPVIRHNGKFVQTEGFCTDVFFDAALGWIKNHRDNREHQSAQPFFAYIATNAPHGPFIAPLENEARFKSLGFEDRTAGFYGMIENIDENMGRLLSKLEQWDLLQETLIIFLSDNGMAGGGSGNRDQPLGYLDDGTPMTFFNANMKGLKGSVDEGGVRVPCFVRWDDHFEANRDIDRIASHIDLLPTLAAITGAEMPARQVEGRSLLPLLRGNLGAWEDRFLFSHKGRWNLGDDPDDFQWRDFSVRNQRYRLVGEDELYDMQLDPSQTVNVFDQHPDIVEGMKAAYAQFWKEARPKMINEHRSLSASRPFHELYWEQEKTSGIPIWKPPQLY